MRQTELAPDPDDRDRWVLPGVGTFLRTGRTSRAATAEAAGRTWKIQRRGLVRTGFIATDESGEPAGELKNPTMGSGETLRWNGRELALRYDDAHRAHALSDGDRALARFAPKVAGKRPLDVVIEDPDVDPGLLLFAAFIVQAYADDASFPQGPSAPSG